jgi:hypothetical protein
MKYFIGALISFVALGNTAFALSKDKNCVIRLEVRPTSTITIRPNVAYTSAAEIHLSMTKGVDQVELTRVFMYNNKDDRNPAIINLDKGGLHLENLPVIKSASILFSMVDQSDEESLAADVFNFSLETGPLVQKGKVYVPASGYDKLEITPECF